MINRNKLAVRVADSEGKKVEVNIGQIKEVQRCLLIELAKFSSREVEALLTKIRKEQL